MTWRRTALLAWWRVPTWVALAVATGLSTHKLVPGLLAGGLMLLAAAAVQFTGDRRSVRTSTTAIILATAAGLAATLIAPDGLGVLPVYIAAARIPFPIDRGAGCVFLVLDTIAVGAVVGYISRSVIGALAGIGIPLVAQRAVERRQLIAARDEAQALLVEVQAGREAEAEAAALRERGRIARDLHDVLAHSLAGLSVQLQATRAVAARDGVAPDVLEPLDKAATLAKDGLADARALVGALRDPGGLGVDQIPALVERQPGEVTLDITGAPAPVGAEASHAAYRAVQEALTNAARYAPGAPVQVVLAYGAETLAVCIDDSGRPTGHTAVPSQGNGLGLAGMDERVRAVGGTVTAGPRPGGGWRVQVKLPVLTGSPA